MGQAEDHNNNQRKTETHILARNAHLQLVGPNSSSEANLVSMSEAIPSEGVVAHAQILLNVTPALPSVARGRWLARTLGCGSLANWSKKQALSCLKCSAHFHVKSSAPIKRALQAFDGECIYIVNRIDLNHRKHRGKAGRNTLFHEPASHIIFFPKIISCYS